MKIKAELSEKALEKKRRAGRKGGKSRSPKKIRAGRRNVKAALRGRAVMKLVRDVDEDIIRNRETWLKAPQAVRAGLDQQFEKLLCVKAELIATHKSSNGESK